MMMMMWSCVSHGRGEGVGCCRVDRVPPEISVSWATMHLAPATSLPVCWFTFYGVPCKDYTSGLLEH